MSIARHAERAMPHARRQEYQAENGGGVGKDALGQDKARFLFGGDAPPYSGMRDGRLEIHDPKVVGRSMRRQGLRGTAAKGVAWPIRETLHRISCQATHA
jgi:hypothetical protein